MDSTNAIVPVPLPTTKSQAYLVRKAGAINKTGKFNAERRARYLEERRMGQPHATACRRAGVSPSTVDRYSAGMGAQWHRAVRLAVEEGLDPIRAVRRAAALEGEPWAVRAEIGDGRAARSGGASDGEAQAGGTVVNVGTLVVGGEAGVTSGIVGLLERLRERERALSDGDDDGTDGPAAGYED